MLINIDGTMARQKSALNALPGTSLARGDSQPVPLALNKFAPITLSNPVSAPQMPDNWQALSNDDRSTLMMQTLLNVQHQNSQICSDLATVTGKINFHSETLSVVTVQHTDMQHAFTDRNPVPEIIISSIPKDITLTADQLAKGFFAFLGLPAEFNDIYLVSTRFANIKLQNATTNSLILRMISREVCEDVLTAASQKRRAITFSVKNIYDINNEATVYVNKMQPTYVQHLAYLARQAKKSFGWKSVWTNNGRVCVKINEQTPVATISLISQLEELAK